MTAPEESPSAAPREGSAADDDGALPVVERGRVHCYRLLDLGDEIDLDRAAQRIEDSAVAGKPTRLRLSRTGAQALSITAPPLDVTLPERELTLPLQTRRAQTRIRLFDFGVASVRFAVEIEPGATLADVVRLCAQVNESALLDEEARRETAALVPRLGDALSEGSSFEGVESYTITFLEQLEGQPRTADVLRARGTIAKLLLGETSPQALAEAEVEEKLRKRFAYLDNDLVVVDWEGALVVEPTGAEDVTDLLEFACAQLVGLRYYDHVLDRELGRIYEEVERAGGRPFQTLSLSYERVAARVQERWLELTEFTDRIDNAIKAVGDQYLARVYRGALDRFGLPVWQQSVYRKQARIAQVYEFLRDGITNRRTVLLEVAIVVLILMEIVLALAGEL